MKSKAVPLQGVFLALTATTLFAFVSPYVKLLSPLSGTDIFAWRVVWTAPFVLILMVAQKRFQAFHALIFDLREDPHSALRLLVCASILGLQQWLFLWAPLHGHMLEVSLGYFVLPIVLVLVGWLVDRQRVHVLQWVAVAFAMTGVAHKLVADADISWPLLVVALGFPTYFLLRRKLQHDSLTLFAAETLLLLPVAIVSIFRSETLSHVIYRIDMLTILLPGLGVVSALSFAAYLKASRILPIALFGLLGYVEPILLVVISTYVFREGFAHGEGWTYIPIFLSVATTALYVARTSSGGEASKTVDVRSLT